MAANTKVPLNSHHNKLESSFPASDLKQNPISGGNFRMVIYTISSLILICKSIPNIIERKCGRDLMWSIIGLWISGEIHVI